jgi:hypothetical protein
MAPRTTPPATTDNRVFFKEGVMAASATSGLDRETTIAVVAVATNLLGALEL